MLPFIFEWHWEVGRLIFMGLFYTALGVVSLAVLVGVLKTIYDLNNPSSGHGGEQHH